MLDIPIQQKKRFAYLNGVRVWAALLVVFHHGTIAVEFALHIGIQQNPEASGTLRRSGKAFVLLVAGGNVVVFGFFAVSEFVLVHAYTRFRQSWPSLVLRRYVRLGIPVLAGCLIAWMLLALELMRNTPAAELTHSSRLAAQFQQRPSLLRAELKPITLLLGSIFLLYKSNDQSLWTMPFEAEMSLIFIAIFVILYTSDSTPDISAAPCSAH